MKSKKLKGVLHEYRPVLEIPLEYVVGITDVGFVQSATKVVTKGVTKFIPDESDDLRLAIELSAGHKFMLVGEQRFYINEGDLIIEDLVPVEEE